MATDGDLEETIRQQVDEWSSNSNDCFTIELIRPDGEVSASFHPAFTYPIFNEEEAIFGYQDLEITLSFAAHSLQPHLSIQYSAKFPKQFNIDPTDIHAALRDFLPDVAFSNVDRSEAFRETYAAKFTPPGDLIHTYKRGGESYVIYCASLSNRAAQELLENVQVLVPMFIEGGTMLQLDQDWITQRWKLFLTYHHDQQDQYSLIGYGTSYRVFTFPERETSDGTSNPIPTESLDNTFSEPHDLISQGDVSSPLDLPSRERLSQFLILPPFQNQGHGRELYSTMYTHLTQPKNIQEFTVEDPNEAFDDLRDLCDLIYLRTREPEFSSLHINTEIPSSELNATERIPVDLIIDGAKRREIQHKTKIVPRQFDRLVEMHTLASIPLAHRSRSRITKRERASNQHDRAYYLWRLYVKQRLYIFNRDSLAQLEREERIEKLEAALDSVQEAYAKTLERAGEKMAMANEDGGSARQEREDKVSPARIRATKRKIVNEVEEDDEEYEGEDEDAEGEGHDTGGGLMANGHKKLRLTPAIE